MTQEIITITVEAGQMTARDLITDIKNGFKPEYEED